jgi:hypothetical protein
MSDVTRRLQVGIASASAFSLAKTLWKEGKRAVIDFQPAAAAAMTPYSEVVDITAKKYLIIPANLTKFVGSLVVTLLTS